MSDHEFAGLPGPVQRRWVTVSTGDHVSGVAWGSGPPEVVLLHAAGGSARDWDGPLAGLGRPALALDLPGHGRSSRHSSAYAPRKLVLPIAEAIRSFAPKAKAVAGTGLGALAAAALAARHPHLVPALILIGTLPGHPAPSDDAEYLWQGLARLAAGGAPVTVVRGSLSDAAVAELSERVPSARLVASEGHSPAPDGPPPTAAGLTPARLADLLLTGPTTRSSS
ncbi:alpha/beta fold hydrolase [Nonomuraea jabiensis]|uniref:Pimeloyl-ACP methyl ester carboxylesterase n=1 Tax=Nonomuraea jabiensis TaxID=882448 RepID=A0A7W9GGL9_9ACTN|nr:alpha/beta hydrolase [Nonomuraea jabiensis]MBB5783231.1 pimeloyl-ACP methyl ester carboxylesterase [Nonomuraea jabiensis]